MSNERKNPFDRAMTQVIQAVGETQARAVTRALVRDLDRQIAVFPSSLLEREFNGSDVDAFAKAEGFTTRRNTDGPARLLSRVRDALNVPSFARMHAMAQEWDPSGDARVAVVTAVQPAFSTWWKGTTDGVEFASLLSTLDPAAARDRAATRAFIYAVAVDLAWAMWPWLATDRLTVRALCWSIGERDLESEQDDLNLSADTRRQIAITELRGYLAALDEWDTQESLRADAWEELYDSESGRAYAALFRDAAMCAMKSTEDAAAVRDSLVRLGRARRDWGDSGLSFTIQSRKSKARDAARWSALPDVVEWLRSRFGCPELRRML